MRAAHPQHGVRRSAEREVLRALHGDHPGRWRPVSYEAQEYFLCHSRATSGAQVRIVWALARHANSESEAWPSVHLLTRYTGMGSRGVRKALRELEKLGEVETMHHSGRDRRVNTYRLSMPACACVRGPDGRIRHVPDRPGDVGEGGESVND